MLDSQIRQERLIEHLLLNQQKLIKLENLVRNKSQNLN